MCILYSIQCRLHVARKLWINRLRVAVSAQREQSSLVEGNRMCCGCENVTQREGVWAAEVAVEVKDTYIFSVSAKGRHMQIGGA